MKFKMRKKPHPPVNTPRFHYVEIYSDVTLLSVIDKVNKLKEEYDVGTVGAYDDVLFCTSIRDEASVVFEGPTYTPSQFQEKIATYETCLKQYNEWYAANKGKIESYEKEELDRKRNQALAEVKRCEKEMKKLQIDSEYYQKRIEKAKKLL